MTTELLLRYFGTSVNSAGHYMWELRGNHAFHKGLDGFRELPFNPESLPEKHPHKGHIEYHQIKGYSIIAIEGAPADARNGSKMVFFVNADLRRDELIQFIKSNRSAMVLIEACRFKIEL